MPINENAINAYLYFGYLPNQSGPGILEKIAEWLAGESDRKSAYEHMSYDRLVDEGIRSFRSSVSSLLSGSARLHVVPLSGGYDSRAIVAELVRLGLRDQMVAVTFGTPGTLDYDIGGYIAKTLGLKHEYIDLRKVEVRTESLFEVVRSGARWTYTLDAYFNASVRKLFGTEAAYWSGFLGDPLAGSHLLAKPPNDWRKAQESFVARNKFCPSNLHDRGWNPYSALPALPSCDNRVVGFDDQLDLGIRQNACISKIVLSELIDVRTPFFTPDWVRFMLCIPRRFREKQKLYIDLLMRAYPREFSLPVKNTYGLPPRVGRLRILARRLLARARRELSKRFHWLPPFVHPMENYIDVDQAIRTRADVRDTFRENITHLQRRDIVPWIDFDELWQDHLRGRCDYGRELSLLLGLELNLKAEDGKLPASVVERGR